MTKSLVIVESPAKAKTIQKYLGPDFTIKASVGHVRDLPKKTLSVDVENSFKPDYEVLADKTKVIADIKKAAKGADNIFLAPDPDREGEAIAFHIVEACGGFKGKNVQRVLFNEITKKGITEAMEKPLEIDQERVNAQQARRILDRLVGYKISPVLWKTVRRGISAGRVQSVALRLIVEREDEVKAFNQEEYWSVLADMKGSSDPQKVIAKLAKVDGKKAKIPNGDEAEKIKQDLADASCKVSKVTKRQRKRSPYAPFITSTLQQEAARRFRFNAKKTMMIAQQLYEGLNVGSEGEVGLITYMRTDSFRVSDEAINFAREYINGKFGNDYIPEKPNTYKSKKSAQEGHEAIRPTEMRAPDEIKGYLNNDQNRIYTIIFQRFIASQMVPAKIDGTTLEVTATGKDKSYAFTATGNVIAFPGFLKLYDDTVEKDNDDDAEEEDKTDTLPDLKEGEAVSLLKLEGKQHFTQPPPRFTEASLIKTLEEKGIGRPSTYASIMTVIRSRDYVTTDKSRRFTPSGLGMTVSKLLTASFNDIINENFTAELEDKLDRVEAGKVDWVKLLTDFYKPFVKDLDKAEEAMLALKAEMEKTDEVCEKCGKPMTKKWGKFGEFLACTGYPECKNTKEMDADPNAEEEEPIDETCEKCGKPMAKKKGRFGDFLACTGYPDCKNTRNIGATGQAESAEPRYVEGEECPKCKSKLQYRQGRFGEFISCSAYPECKYIKKQETRTDTKCTECGGDLMEKKSRFGKLFYSCEHYPKCKFAIWNKPINKPCPECNAPFLMEKTTKRKGTFYLCHKEDCNYETDSLD